MDSDIEDAPRRNSEPKQMKCDLERKVTAIGQIICGILSIGLGIALFFFRSDGRPPWDGWDTRRFNVVANGSFGIWCGMMFAAAGIIGLIKRNNICMVSTYLGMSTANMLVFAIVLIGAAVAGMGFSITKGWYPNCPYQPSSYYTRHYSPCCLDRSQCPPALSSPTSTQTTPSRTITQTTPSGTIDAGLVLTTIDERSPFSDRSYSWNMDRPARSDDDYDSPYWHANRGDSGNMDRPARPNDDYDSPNCTKLRECLPKYYDILVPNKVLLGGLLAVSVLEAFISVYATFSTLIAICSVVDCCCCCNWHSIKEFFRRRPREIVYVAYPLPQMGNSAETQPLNETVAEVDRPHQSAGRDVPGTELPFSEYVGVTDGDEAMISA